MNKIESKIKYLAMICTIRESIRRQTLSIFKSWLLVVYNYIELYLHRRAPQYEVVICFGRRRSIVKTLKVAWKIKKVKDTSRVNAMYCFKHCERNQN